MPNISNAYTDSTPSAAVLGDRLYVAFKNTGSDSISIAHTDNPADDSSWHLSTLPTDPLPGEGPGPRQIRTSHGPALSVIGSSLWLAFRGHNNPLIWLVSYSPPAWCPEGYLLNAQTTRGPAMVGPMVVHRGNSDDQIWYQFIAFAPSHGEPSIAGTQTNCSPAVVFMDPVVRTHPLIAYRDSRDSTIRFTLPTTHPVSHETVWTEPERIPGAWSREGPALAMHDGLLYVAFKSGTNNQIWIGSYDGSFWNLHGTVPNLFTSEAPALVSFGSTLYVVCKGHNNDRVWYREVPVHTYRRALDTDFRPHRNGFSFENFSEGIPDWETFRDTFGHQEIDKALGEAVANAALFGGLMPGLTDPYFFFGFYGFYCGFTDGTINTGLCSAYSACSLQRYMDDVTSQLFNQIPSVTSANGLPHNIRRELTVAFGRLLGAQNLTALAAQCRAGRTRIRRSFREIERDLMNGSGRDSARILFFIPSGLNMDLTFWRNLFETHAVVPYRIEYPATSSTDPIRLYVYDCNSPGNSSPVNPGFSVIEFRELADGQFDFVFLTGATASHPNADLQSANGFTLGTLSLHDYLDRDVSLPITTQVGMIIDFFLSPVELQIRNQRGQLTGQKDGKIYWEIPGSFPIYPLANAFLLPDGKYVREIRGTGAGQYTFCTLNPDGTGCLLRSKANGGSRQSLEKLTIDNQARKIVIETNDYNKECSLALRSVDDDGIKIVYLYDINLVRNKPLTLHFNTKLDSIKSEYEGDRYSIRARVLNVPKTGGPLRTTEARLSLRPNISEHLRVSYGEVMSINLAR